MIDDEREKKLNEIEGLIKSFYNSDLNKYSGLSASYFMPNCFSHNVQGIVCSCKNTDQSIVDEFLGYIDIPIMMSGLSLEILFSQTDNTYRIFIYDDENYHIDNLRKMSYLSINSFLDRKNIR